MSGPSRRTLVLGAGALAGAPWWGVLAVVAGALGIGLFFPLIGVSLLGFIVVDALLSLRSPRARG